MHATCRSPVTVRFYCIIRRDRDKIEWIPTNTPQNRFGCPMSNISSTIGQATEIRMSATKNPLTPELCRTFVLLVRSNGSVTATARQLELNEASISKRIRPLVHGSQPHLPRPWLEKRGKKFHLTAEGRIMLPAAEEHAERWHQFESFASAGRTGGLTVACGQEAAGGIVLSAATSFRKQHPKASFRIAVVRGRQRIEGVANGLYDLALVPHPPVAVREIARREVIIEPLIDDELGLACAIKSEWGKMFTESDAEIGVAELTRWPLVLPESDSAIRKQWDERVRRHESAESPRVAIEVGGWRVLLGYVLAGFGVGLLPRSVAVEAGAKVRWRPLTPTLRPANRVYTVRLPTSAANECAESFLRVLESAKG